MASIDKDRLKRMEEFKRAIHPSGSWKYSYRDIILYALSIGCKRTELCYVFEKDAKFAALPTFAVVAVHKAGLAYQSLLPNFDPVSLDPECIRRQLLACPDFSIALLLCACCKCKT